VLGTADDRLTIPPRWRVLAEVGVAIVLHASGLGWSVFGAELPDLLLTVVWIVGLCNAFNLMDNLDGAAPTVAGVSAAGIAAVAVVHDDVALAGLAFALAGACAGFLPHNLAGPARLFLGDGGSLPLGFLVATGAMLACDAYTPGAEAVPYAALLVGLVIFDVALVTFSRRRAGVPLITAGRDHLSHRLLSRLGDPRRVAAALAAGQLALCAAAIVAAELAWPALAVVAGVAVAGGVAAVALLDSPAWRPPRPALPARPGARAYDTVAESR
jgi:UDP-GlcNAc:undecaprenyl-phosphate GlcNAc-1-phosphate transferase